MNQTLKVENWKKNLKISQVNCFIFLEQNDWVVIRNESVSENLSVGEGVNATPRF
jgi:hypothetical protein